MTELARPQSDTTKLEQRHRELSILNAIAQALNREVDLTRALQTALAQVAELLDLHTGWVYLIDEDTEDFYLAAAQTLPPALADDPERMEGECYCLDTYRAGDLDGAANVNVVACSRLWGLVDGTDNLRYHASIPLYAHGKQLGVLNVASADWRGLSADDLRLLYTVGDMLSIAIERAKLFERSAQIGVVHERNRLAREIHDTLAQGMAAIALQLETADALLEGRDKVDRARAAVRNALSLTRSNLDEARRSVLDLRAAPLEGRSLPDALAALCAQPQLRLKHHLQVQLSVQDDLTAPPPRIENGLYRIAQEAITNAAKHAHAQHVWVRLSATAEHMTLTVEDDGRGFDAANTPKGRYGLVGLNERAKLMGGVFTVQSTPGEGTRLEVSVPLNWKPEPSA